MANKILRKIRIFTKVKPDSLAKLVVCALTESHIYSAFNAAHKTLDLVGGVFRLPKHDNVVLSTSLFGSSGILLIV